MRESRVIEQNGVFVGAAVRLDNRAHHGAPAWRFVAVNGWLKDLNGSYWATLTELREATARGFFSTSRRPPSTVSTVRPGAHPLP